MEGIIKLLTIGILFFLIIQPLSIERAEVPLIYQLQKINLRTIYSYYKPKFLIIDVQDIDEEDIYYIKKLKENGTTILSYLSIGEAEDYRSYWKKEWNKNPPEWLGSENPMWPGNYKVKYWYIEWQNIVFNMIDEILKYEVDGLYLDLIDSFIYWSENGYPKEFTALQMIDFVFQISNYLKSKGNFLVVPQNGENILDYDTSNNYINAIDGIGIESLFFKYTKRIDEKITLNRLKYIQEIQNQGKFVLVTDYIFSPFYDNS
ncbi:MJ1477/TM1410 family putative glycoside hydrolase, partial [Thermosipho sp. (in: thermotogales)]|uniref:MJ1477/TM1410 family putative glycoside hydrolase n=1 Tax=Thermosipho sp. (in: thermotogales) TaxID=1968895 RepID=UPI00257C20A1